MIMIHALFFYFYRMTEKKPGSILIVDDDWDVLRAAQLLLKRHFKKVDIERNPQQIPYLLNHHEYDTILLDMNFTRDVSSGKEGFEWLDRILDLKPEAKVVLFTAYGDVEMAVRAIKAGAKDFVLKPWENEKLLSTLKSAAGMNTSGHSVQQQADGPFITGESPLMQEMLETAEKVAPTDANVLLLGENGTGKDLLARHIHQVSSRNGRIFVPVDMGAIPETLFESELLGHVKGAFTDAHADRAGRFEEANGGSIFLDEISNLSMSAQAKLLTVLQTREVVRVGSNKARPVDVRLICASNRDLQQLVREGDFRQDLLYRINTIEIHIPPLRDRKEDIPLLAEHFLCQYSEQYQRKVKGLSSSLIHQLQQYAWPGNVRELQHAIERAVILSGHQELTMEDVFSKSQSAQVSPGTRGEVAGFNLEEMERKLILAALKRHSGNVSDAAQELGLSRPALYRRMEKYGI